MSLHTDPSAIIKDLRTGRLSGSAAKREIDNLLSEISSGIYTFEDLGLKNERELKRLRQGARSKTLH